MKKKTLTQKEAIEICRGFGYTLKRTGWDDEYVVKLKGDRNPDTGYFTNDLQDAVSTAEAMYEARREQEQNKALAPSLED